MSIHTRHDETMTPLVVFERMYFSICVQYKMHKLYNFTTLGQYCNQYRYIWYHELTETGYEQFQSECGKRRPNIRVKRVMRHDWQRNWTTGHMPLIKNWLVLTIARRG